MSTSSKYLPFNWDPSYFDNNNNNNGNNNNSKNRIPLCSQECQRPFSLIYLVSVCTAWMHNLKTMIKS